MFDGLRAKSHGASLARIFLYEFILWLTRQMWRVLFRAKAFHAERAPAAGPLLIAANHQSFLDPPLVSVFITQRHMSFLARSGLFRFGPFARLILWLNSIPINEEQSDTAAIKEILRRLDAGGAVLIFPEGSRTGDGAMHAFKRVVALLVKKSSCPVLPVAIEGTYDVWPRDGRPRLFSGPIYVEYGNPIPHDELMANGPDGALRRLEAEIAAMRMSLRARLRERTRGRLPKPGPGDAPHVLDPEF